MAKWEAEFNQLMEHNRDFDYAEDMEAAWKGGLGDFGNDFQAPDAIKYNDEGIPLLDPYKFGEYLDKHPPSFLYLLSTETSNPFLEEPGGHLAKAKHLLQQNGSLTEIALLLEAAIQHGELGEGGYEAWILLGETRSMDEREEAGMRALTEGVRLAQLVGNNEVGMIVRLFLLHGLNLF